MHLLQWASCLCIERFIARRENARRTSLHFLDVDTWSWCHEENGKHWRKCWCPCFIYASIHTFQAPISRQHWLFRYCKTTIYVSTAQPILFASLSLLKWIIDWGPAVGTNHLLRALQRLRAFTRVVIFLSFILISGSIRACGDTPCSRMSIFEELSLAQLFRYRVYG